MLVLTKGFDEGSRVCKKINDSIVACAAQHSFIVYPRLQTDSNVLVVVENVADALRFIG